MENKKCLKPPIRYDVISQSEMLADFWGRFLLLSIIYREVVILPFKGSFKDGS
jgi:hypothetical protein